MTFKDQRYVHDFRRPVMCTEKKKRTFDLIKLLLSPIPLLLVTTIIAARRDAGTPHLSSSSQRTLSQFKAIQHAAVFPLSWNFLALPVHAVGLEATDLVLFSTLLHALVKRFEANVSVVRGLVVEALP